MNLADPLAMVAVAFWILHCITTRRLPAWRFGSMNISLFLIALSTLLAFTHGVIRFGVTQWALGNRLAALPVIGGYLATGALAVSVLGTRAQRRLAQCLVLAAAVATLLHFAMRLGASVGLVNPELVPYNFEGFSGNRNAYAVQMLLSVCAAIVWMRYSTSLRDGAWLMVPAGICLFGLFMSQSRAGLITAAVIMSVAFVAKVAPLRMLIATFSIAIVTFILTVSLRTYFLDTHFFGLPKAVQPVSDHEHWIFGLPKAVQPVSDHEHWIFGLPKAVRPVSDHERWISIIGGLKLWMQHPFFGAGLGAFTNTHKRQGISSSSTIR